MSVVSISTLTISEGELGPDLDTLGPLTVLSTDVKKDVKQDWLGTTKLPVLKKVSRR